MAQVCDEHFASTAAAPASNTSTTMAATIVESRCVSKLTNLIKSHTNSKYAASSQYHSRYVVHCSLNLPTRLENAKGNTLVSTPHCGDGNADGHGSGEERWLADITRRKKRSLVLFYESGHCIGTVEMLDNKLNLRGLSNMARDSGPCCREYGSDKRHQHGNNFKSGGILP